MLGKLMLGNVGSVAGLFSKMLPESFPRHILPTEVLKVPSSHVISLKFPECLQNFLESFYDALLALSTNLDSTRPEYFGINS